MGQAQGEVVVELHQEVVVELHQEMQQLGLLGHLEGLVVGVVKLQMLRCLEVVGVEFLGLEE